MLKLLQNVGGSLKGMDTWSARRLYRQQTFRVRRVEQIVMSRVEQCGCSRARRVPVCSPTIPSNNVTKNPRTKRVTYRHCVSCSCPEHFLPCCTPHTRQSVRASSHVYHVTWRRRHALQALDNRFQSPTLQDQSARWRERAQAGRRVPDASV